MLKESALVALIAAVVLVAAVAAAVRRTWKPRVNPGTDWNFTDSWASTATVGASALAAVFGSSDVVTAVAGGDATVAPLIVVGSALALAVVTAAPLVVKVCSAGDEIWTIAIAVAAVLTLGAAGFEGLLIVRLARTLNLGGIESWTLPVGVVLAALLVVYAVRSLSNIFTMDQVGEEGFVPGTRRRAAIL